ncbi:RusA family crossover junction endodeoxyribonuclease [Allobaculum stercoricanis]|uniref:RusA family crossover junction endodeoxyribonuclease n=1 Tax=Allobaculum stercoricanis TaxID=174709 RepID=UPI002943B38B|nr:RusA family crossover junction endodeoxyribonuclease [Allobaculum stercoricanis]
MRRINIFIPEQPSKTTHQSGTRYANKRTYKTASLIGWENTLKRHLIKHVPNEPMHGALYLDVVFGFTTCNKKNIGKWKTTRPDTDNMIKTVKDMMTRLGYWDDDSQVVYETCRKMWTKKAGILIRIESLNESWIYYTDDYRELLEKFIGEVEHE